MFAGREFDVSARLAVVECENDQLRERIAQLEATLGLDFMAPVEWRLTASEAAIVGCLLAREVATKEALLLALHRDPTREVPEIKIVDVFVCKARKKLTPFGVEIVTHWGVGYSLAPTTKNAIRLALSGAVV